MPRKIGSVDRSVLLNAALPNATKSYTVISHSYAINTILQALEDNNFNVESEEYRCTQDAQVAHGAFIITDIDDDELRMVYSFTNSYNKSLRFRSSVGAQVLQNGAFMICDMDHWNRKHTGTADDETEELIKSHISNASKYFDQLREAKEQMKNITVDKATVGQTVGELFINNFITIDQISIIGKEYENPSFNYGVAPESLWTLYNHVIYALRQSHPSKWMQNQISVHLFFCVKFELNIFDEDENSQAALQPGEQLVLQEILDESTLPILPGFELPVVDEPMVKSSIETKPIQDPNQIDLEDSIKEILEEQVHQEPEVIESEEIKSIRQAQRDGTGDFGIPLFNSDLSQKITKSGQSNLENLIENNLDFSIKPVTDTVDMQVPPTPKQEPIPVEEKIEPVKAIIPEPIEEPIEVEVRELRPQTETYFQASDFPGLTSGEVFEDDEVYYSVVRFETLEGVDHIVCTPISGFEEEEKEEYVKVENPTTSLQEIVPEVIVEEKLLEQDFEIEKDNFISVMNPNDPIYKVMLNELEEIYGYRPTFNYVLSNNQYNITLESGETITLSSAYIESML